MVVQVEASVDLPIVVIRANAAFHYNAIQKGAHHETIEWALKVELGQECRLRLLPPGQSVPLPASTVPSSSARAAPVASARQSVRLERPASTSPRDADAFVQHDAAQSSVDAPAIEAPSLAINAVVSENTTISTITPGTGNTGEGRREMIEKKAKNDPVVQEVARLFKAEIKDIRLK